MTQPITPNQADTTLDIRPSPRILRILGDIEFEPWQCIAELIDNAFDDFLEVHGAGTRWPDGYKVSVTLPDVVSPSATIRIEDSGRGMDLATLNNAVRAGWSSNDRFSKLGLFGMGFNIATARLGKQTRVFTARPQDTEWVGVEIDLDTIRDDFKAPLIRRPKERAGEHGTTVEVSKLEHAQAQWLTKNAAKLRTTLGDVYAHLLDRYPFSLFVNQVRVDPRRACIWDDTRSVVYGSGSTAEKIPAVIRFDEALPPADGCLVCGSFQSTGLAECSECGSTQLQRRDRRIHGWLGIQRYIHKTDFGIDFLRNGRKILRQDKRIFSWTDPDDPLASANIEYPIELGHGGRIVGEVHLDHVPVNYQKNAFEWSDKQWISAVRYLRGDGPLLPKAAKARGYAQNDSPLAKLHRGYRRNDPGYRYLIPGDGKGPIHTDAYEWSAKFHKRVPEFQSDQRWWDAVVLHENRGAGLATDPPADGGGASDVLTELGLDQKPAPPTTSQPPSKPATQQVPETEKERAERLRLAGTLLPSLSKEYALAEYGSVDVQAYGVQKQPVHDIANKPVPLWLWREQGKKYLAFIHEDHPLFTSFAVEPAVLLALEIANVMKIRSETNTSLPNILSSLIEERFPSLRVDQATLAAQARELLDDIRTRLAASIAENPDRAWQYLSTEERAQTETTLVVSGEAKVEDAQSSGDFIRFTPATFIARLVNEWPESALDERVFRTPYATLGSDATREFTLARVVSLLYDAAVLAESPRLAPLFLAKGATSLQLLRFELSGSGVA